MAGQGFEGFLAISHLRRSRLAEVPVAAGVYVVMRSTASRPAFLATSAGGWFKGKDPTVPVSVLEARWIKSAEVIYIGKATTGTSGRSGLRQRTGQLLAYGSGKPVGHQGHVRQIRLRTTSRPIAPRAAGDDISRAHLTRHQPQHRLAA